MLKITVDDKASKKFGQVVDKFPEFMEDSTLKSVLYVHQNVPRYPPAPANSFYRRTGLLGRSVTTLMGKGPSEALSRVEKPLFGKVHGFIGTKVKYAQRVIDKENQTELFASYWWNLQDVVTGLRKGIRDIYKKSLSAFFRKAG